MAWVFLSRAAVMFAVVVCSRAETCVVISTSLDAVWAGDAAGYGDDARYGDATDISDATVLAGELGGYISGDTISSSGSLCARLASS
jgi:hypothetical protein